MARANPRAKRVKVNAELVHRARYSLFAIINFSEQMDKLPLTGWTVGESIHSLARAVREGLASLPPGEGRSAKPIADLVRETRRLLDTLQSFATTLKDSDYDSGMAAHKGGATVLGAGLEVLGINACKAFERAAFLLDPEENMFYEAKEDVLREYGLSDLKLAA